MLYLALSFSLVKPRPWGKNPEIWHNSCTQILPATLRAKPSSGQEDFTLGRAEVEGKNGLENARASLAFMESTFW